MAGFSKTGGAGNRFITGTIHWRTGFSYETVRRFAEAPLVARSCQEIVNVDMEVCGLCQIYIYIYVCVQTQAVQVCRRVGARAMRVASKAISF